MNEIKWVNIDYLSKEEYIAIAEYNLDEEYPEHFWKDMVDYQWLQDIIKNKINNVIWNCQENPAACGGDELVK